MSVRYMKYSDFPLQEFEMRYEKVRRLMREREIDALLVTTQNYVEYFTGFMTNEWFVGEFSYVALLPKEGEPVLVVPDFMSGVAKGTSWVKDVRNYNAHRLDLPQEQFVLILVKAIKDLGLDNKVIGTELGLPFQLRLPYEYFEVIKADLPKARFVNAIKLMELATMVKSKLEIERVRKAGSIACKAFKKTFESLREGMSEREIARIFNIALLEAETDELGWLVVRSGLERHQMPATSGTDRKLRKGDLLFIDGGAIYRKYACDISREAYIGKPIPEEHQEIYNIVLEGNAVGIEAVKPGVKVSDVYEAISNTMSQSLKVHGYKCILLGILGHGVGRWPQEIHRSPFIRPTEDIRLEPGMVISIEPWMQNPSRGTFACEDNVLVTQKGCELLTPCPKELWAVPC